MPSLAEEVEGIDVKFVKSIRRAKLSTDISSLWVSVMSHMSMSFCGSAI